MRLRSPRGAPKSSPRRKQVYSSWIFPKFAYLLAAVIALAMLALRQALRLTSSMEALEPAAETRKQSDSIQRQRRRRERWRKKRCDSVRVFVYDLPTDLQPDYASDSFAASSNSVSSSSSTNVKADAGNQSIAAAAAAAAYSYPMYRDHGWGAGFSLKVRSQLHFFHDTAQSALELVLHHRLLHSCHRWVMQENHTREHVLLI